MTRVWPALWPPWKRTTTSARLDSQSTSLPLPSSPHWAPITVTLAMGCDPPTRQVGTPPPFDRCSAGGLRSIVGGGLVAARAEGVDHPHAGVVKPLVLAVVEHLAVGDAHPGKLRAQPVGQVDAEVQLRLEQHLGPEVDAR